MASFGFETTGKDIVTAFASEVPGKTIVITGASDQGLGAQSAIDLAAAKPAKLILLARTQQKVQPVIDKIQSISPSTSAVFVPVELDKVASVRAAAEQINKQTDKIDVLMNNAGIMAVPYAKTELGIDPQLATNHVGHFLFTKLLMPKILAAGKGARIINVSSTGHCINTFNFDDPTFGNGAKYSPFGAYGQSKTANILFSVALASKFAKQGILSYSLHPGVIYSTSLANHIEESDFDFDAVQKTAIENTGESFEMGETKTVDQGTATQLRASLDPSLASQSGAYLFDCQATPARAYASSPENAERLWKWTEDLLGEKFDV